jgi:hypothetical protein
MESAERAVLKHHPGVSSPAEGCPPDFLVRAAVLQTDEPVLAHVAGCPHCMNIYMGALGGHGHQAHRPQ